MAKYKKRLVEFYSAMGVNDEGIKREDWPAAVNSFAQKERQRIQNRKWFVYRFFRGQWFLDFVIFMDFHDP